MSGRGRLDLASLLSAMDAAVSEDEGTDGSSSARSYHSNGHDGLTDVEDMGSCDEAPHAPLNLPTPSTTAAGDAGAAHQKNSDLRLQPPSFGEATIGLPSVSFGGSD